MKKDFMKKYWFGCFTIVILLLSVLFVEISRALGTTIILDSLDGSSTEYKVTHYSDYSVIEINEGGEYTLTQNDINSVVNANIIIDSDEDVTLILDGINVKAGSYLQKSVFSNAQYGTAAISIQGDTNCKIVLKDDSVNTLTGYTEYDKSNTPVNNSFYHTAAISVENTIVDDDVRLATLIIEGENGNSSNGILNANGGNQSAAIGASCNRLTGNITINSGVINAVSGDYGAAIGDGDTVQGGGSRYDEEKGSIVWAVGETNSVATIEINGGELWATATKDTPGIGTADNLVKGYHAEVDIWTGLQIEVNGGVVVAIGGVQAYNPSSAIGPGSNTFVSSNNIVINKGEGDTATQIIAVTRTDSGSYPVSNSGGDAIPVLSADSTASILNVKFNESKIAKQLDFWYYVDPTYSVNPTSDFPNSLLERMGSIEVLGLAVLLPEGKYKITQDIDNNGADENDPVLDEGLLVGGAGSITCDEDANGSVYCRYPLEVRSPSDLTVTKGESANFDVEVLQHSEGSTLTYQWYVSTDSGFTWNILTGETSTEYTISETLLSDSGNLYRCDVTEDFYGENVVLSSLPAKLTVLRELEYGIDISVKLDENLYISNDSTFELYDSEGNKIRNLNLVDGVLNTTVPANTYRIYIDGKDIGKDFVVSESLNSFEINYYSVNLKLNTSNNYDGVLINGVKYVDDVLGDIVVLENSTVSLKAVTDEERIVVKYTLNEVISDVSSIVNGYTIDISTTINLFVEFDAITYDVTISNYLDGAIYSDILGEFKLYNDNDVFVADLNNNLGVLKVSIPAGSYKILLDGKKTLEFVVTSNNKSFEINYYSVNLVLDSVTGEDIVEINNSCFKNDTLKNEIIVLGGASVPIKAILELEMYISTYTVNGEDGNKDKLVEGYNLLINDKTDIVINISMVSYDIIVNTILDGNNYSDNSNSYSLCDSSENKIISLNNNNGILSGNVVSGDYYLYENDIKTNVVLSVNSSSLEFNVNYYTINIDLVNNNGIDYILFNNNKYTDDLSGYVVLANTEIEIKAVPDIERNVSKYLVNENGTDTSDILNGKKYIIKSKNNFVVEYAFVEYSINIDINLDGSLYKEISSKFDLYDKNNDKYELTLSNGKLTGEVLNGDYYVYQDDINIGKKINVNSKNKEFTIDYYSVSLDLEGVTEGDFVTINDKSYNSDVSSIIVLGGNKISLRGITGNEKEVKNFTINGKDDNISYLLNGYDLTINDTTEIFVEFKNVLHPIEIKILLDDVLYESIEGIFTLYDDNGNKVSNLTRSDGILSTSLETGTYYVYKDGINTMYSIVVSGNTNKFEMFYYTVNLNIKTVNILDNVEINGASYYMNTLENEIILLKGSAVEVKLKPSADTEVYDLNLNNEDITICDKFDFKMDNKKNIYVEFGNKKYDSIVNVYVDEELSSIDEVISFDFIKDDVVYSVSDKFTNGNYQIRLNGIETEEYIEINKGVINVYFYNVFIDSDKGVNTTNGEGLYLKGTNVLVEATLKPGYKFLGWFIGSDNLNTGFSYEIIDISKKYDLKATSSALAPYEPVLNPVNGNYEYDAYPGKEISLEVIPYEGTVVESYQWYKCDDSECLNKNVIDDSIDNNYFSTEVDVGEYYYYNEVVILREDNSEKLVTGSIVKLNIVPITPIISLNDKVAYYTGIGINIDEGIMDNIIGDDKFDVTYKYYLDEELTILTDNENSGALTVGGAPVNVGTYYVSMVLGGNKNYNEVSSIAKLDIIERILEEVKDEDVVEEENPNTLDKVVLVVVALFLGGLVLIKSFINTSKYHI